MIASKRQSNLNMFNKSLRLAWDGFADPAHASSRSVSRIQPSQDVSLSPSIHAPKSPANRMHKHRCGIFAYASFLCERVSGV